MEETKNVASYKEVSEELGKKLIKLYGVKIFPRQGKVFADMLFQTGIEAGTYIASLTDIDERGIRIKLATEAMVKLNQTMYLITVMKEARYYEPHQVAEMEDFMQELLRAMRNVLNTAFAQGRARAAAAQPAPVKHAPIKPAHTQAHLKQAPKAQIISAPAPQPVTPPQPAVKQVNVDPDGFNSPIAAQSEVAAHSEEEEE